MEIQKEGTEKQFVNKKRSDWCKALSYYSAEQKICNNCFTQKSQLNHFILPLDKAAKKLENVNLNKFERSLRQVGKPLILTNNQEQLPAAFLVYFTLGIDFEQLPTSLSLNHKGEKPKATIVSPDYYSKSKRTSETQLVREVQKYFDPTAFIKLPLYDLNDLIAYASSEKCEMLILPMNKLADYLELVLKNKAQKIMSAAFYPIKG